MTRLDEIKQDLEMWKKYPGTQAPNFLMPLQRDMNYLISRVEKLEAALKFYADQEPTHKLPFSEGDTDPDKLNAPLIPLPLGVARAALSETDEEMKSV